MRSGRAGSMRNERRLSTTIVRQRYVTVTVSPRCMASKIFLADILQRVTSSYHVTPMLCDERALIQIRLKTPM